MDGTNINLDTNEWADYGNGWLSIKIEINYSLMMMVQPPMFSYKYLSYWRISRML